MVMYGGIISWKVKEFVRMIVSGFIGGVIGFKLLGEMFGYDNIVCSDIGGMSFDMAFIVKSNFNIVFDFDMARFVLFLLFVVMDFVGVGVGSFVRIDLYSWFVKLGFDSVGYRVGICWKDSGLDMVLVIDCYIVLGYLNLDNFLGGLIKLDVDRVKKYIKE